jgi:predicted N-acetyltransferase YhbS
VREQKHPIIGDLSGITAEVSLLYVLPEHMGKRLGRALFGRSAQRLTGLGHTGLLIWGHRDNPFLRFYERLGGIAAAQSSWEVDGRLYPSTAYVWRDLPALIAACGVPLST